MNAWVASALALIAVVIAYMQYFLSRQKFVLDLFDRRYRAYADVLAAVRPIVAASKAEHNQMVDLQIAINGSKFLFGSDVNDYLNSLWITAVRLNYWNSIYNTSSPDAANAPQGIYDCSMKFAEFFTAYPALAQNYMMMPEKRIRTPLEWFKDRNSLRKSYGDEPKNVIK